MSIFGDIPNAGVIRIEKIGKGLWSVNVGRGVVPGLSTGTKTFETKSAAIDFARGLGDGTARIVADKASSKVHLPANQRATEVIHQGR